MNQLYIQNHTLYYIVVVVSAYTMHLLKLYLLLISLIDDLRRKEDIFMVSTMYSYQSNIYYTYLSQFQFSVSRSVFFILFIFIGISVCLMIL